MKISVFTSNQPRHLSLIKALSEFADVHAVVECVTVFPGDVEDFYRKSDTMREYFTRVLAAERAVFGSPSFLPATVSTLPIKMGDLNRLSKDELAAVLDADVHIVFGASFIKGWLVDFLVEHRAVNIHMGVSPYYRGSGCNFWALYDKRPEYVGATIHLLSKGLDSGAILFHALPKAQATEPFVLGMRAVKAAHDGLIAHIRAGDINSLVPLEQEKNEELRYSRYDEFTDDVAAEYLSRTPSPAEVKDALEGRDPNLFLRPFIG